MAPSDKFGAGSLTDTKTIDAYYKALISRDSRFDGQFFTGVTSTGVYCRPVCPAIKPKLSNCRFFRHAAEAQAARFRPCRRCRPEVAPFSPAWLGTNATVRRAVRLIFEGAFMKRGAEGVADSLGVSSRHLSRLFQAEMGTSPKEFSDVVRMNFAGQLLLNSDLSIAQVAFSSGFGSLRRFNEAFREVYDRTPSEYRKAAQGSIEPTPKARFRLVRLYYRPPFDWSRLVKFFKERAVPGLEHIDGMHYCRLVTFDEQVGTLRVDHSKDKRHLDVSLDFVPEGPKAAEGVFDLVERVKALFDLDFDPSVIQADLQSNPDILKVIEASGDVRVPGAWGLFEVGVRAIIGQQITVTAARKLLVTFVQTFGERVAVDTPQKNALCYFFPSPEKIAKADLSCLKMPNARRETLRALADLMMNVDATNMSKADDVLEKISAIKGIGPWTLNYIRLRGFKDPDAFPHGDTGLLAGARATNIADTPAALSDIAENWRPWRAYVATALWSHMPSSNTKKDTHDA